MSGYYLYRAAVARYIDRLFYEEGNRQRCHSRCHKLLIRQLCGIGDNTYWNYRHLPEPTVAEYALRTDIKMLLRLQVLLVKVLPPVAVQQVLAELCLLVADVIRTTKKENTPLSASIIIMRIQSRVIMKQPLSGEE